MKEVIKPGMILSMYVFVGSTVDCVNCEFDSRCRCLFEGQELYVTNTNQESSANLRSPYSSLIRVETKFRSVLFFKKDLIKLLQKTNIPSLICEYVGGPESLGGLFRCRSSEGAVLVYKDKYVISTQVKDTQSLVTSQRFIIDGNDIRPKL
ncbi:hypothetical protein EDC01DRAFT_641915 [Geopyxis carbonaria]|nr:hypothetical protein EDC01DRAFT_641915 [Geopyxis carbonaria]